MRIPWKFVIIKKTIFFCFLEFVDLIIVINGIIINDITYKRIAVKRRYCKYHMNNKITNIGDIRFISNISNSFKLKPNYSFMNFLILYYVVSL